MQDKKSRVILAFHSKLIPTKDEIDILRGSKYRWQIFPPLHVVRREPFPKFFRHWAP